jgi:hypothetical protein
LIRLDRRAWQYVFIGVRVFGAVVVVAFMEEIFWRGFLIRWIDGKDFKRVPIGVCSWKSFGITVVVFGFEHEQWLAGMVCGALYNWLYCRRKDLFSCVLAHATQRGAGGMGPVRVGSFGEFAPRDMKIVVSLILVILGYSVMVSVWQCFSSPLIHDEHQFMASAFMVAQYGLHPYQDFAYFHMPNLVYLYAPFFFIPYPFMVARLFGVICALGICLTIFLTARSLFAGHEKLNSLIIPVCSAALLIHSPLFHYASSHVLNHTPSTLCAVLAFLHCCYPGQQTISVLLMSG